MSTRLPVFLPTLPANSFLGWRVGDVTGTELGKISVLVSIWQEIQISVSAWQRYPDIGMILVSTFSYLYQYFFFYRWHMAEIGIGMKIGYKVSLSTWSQGISSCTNLEFCYWYSYEASSGYWYQYQSINQTLTKIKPWKKVMKKQKRWNCKNIWKL